FLEALLFSGRIINTKTSSFILNGVLLEAGTTLDLYTTDLEASIKTSVEVKIEEKGKVVVPLKILSNVLKSLDESKIGFYLNEETNQVQISCGNANFILNTLSLEEFPGFPELKKENTFKISMDKLKKIVTKVQKATSTDESRVILTGVLVETSERNITMVATDSYRLASYSEEIEKGYPEIKVVVPEKVLDSVVKSETDGGEIEVNIGEKQIAFLIKKNGKIKNTVISRLISGKFPDYKQLIPPSSKHNIIVDREKMLDVVRRISSISQDNMPVKLLMEKGEITVEMDIKEIGRSSEGFQIPYDGERIEIAFNPGFLIDGLTMIEGKNIVISINDSLKPILLTPEKEKGLLYLIMPIKVS
ncbi:MAG: DNA polymerase III subunit beta, partial [Actinobacteria bacterium]|nr:DNA polymerase III subunit beta [Actinomycetota bacterium]